MINVYIYGCLSDIDDYINVSLDDPRPLQGYEFIDILEINSLYHFFECIDIDAYQDAYEIYMQLTEKVKSGELPF